MSRYRSWADTLRDEAERAGLSIPDGGYSAVYYFPMPASWSKKKRDRMRGTPHQVKPDVDNVNKAVLDVLRKDDDAAVWRMGTQEKRWADEGSMLITPLPD